MSKISKGDIFKSAILKNQFGEKIDLSQVIGKEACIIFFYPKDFTAGCTKEVCSFQDNLAALNNAGVSVFGISSDSVDKHRAFAEKYGIKYDLLSDEKGAYRKSIGVSADLFGLIPGRVTYLIDEEGKVVGTVGNQLKIDNHIGAALQFAQNLKAV